MECKKQEEHEGGKMKSRNDKEQDDEVAVGEEFVQGVNVSLHGIQLGSGQDRQMFT